MRRTCLAFVAYLFGLTAASGWSQSLGAPLKGASWRSPVYMSWKSARRRTRRSKEKTLMAAARGPTDAIVALLADELRRLIYGLPASFQESLPERLKDTLRDEGRNTHNDSE